MSIVWITLLNVLNVKEKEKNLMSKIYQCAHDRSKFKNLIEYHKNYLFY